MMSKDDGHDYHGPADHTDYNDSETCQACVLSYCKTCHGAEGSLPTQCPGRAMTNFEEKTVMAGVLDFNGGKRWVLGSWFSLSKDHTEEEQAAAIHDLVDEQTAKFIGYPELLRKYGLSAMQPKMNLFRVEYNQPIVEGTVCIAVKDPDGVLRLAWCDLKKMIKDDGLTE